MYPHFIFAFLFTFLMQYSKQDENAYICHIYGLTGIVHILSVYTIYCLATCDLG